MLQELETPPLPAQAYRKNDSWKSAAFVLLLAVGCFVIFVTTKDLPFKGDEEAHYTDQIARYLDGDYKIGRTLTMLPGYHILVAVIMGSLGVDSVAAARGVHVALSFGVMMLFWGVCRKFYPSLEHVKTLQFIFCPLIFPFFFMIYTDVLAVGLILISFYFVKKRRFILSAVFGLLSCCVRQNDIVWVAFLLVYSLFPLSGDQESWGQRLKRCWPFLVVFLLFAVFVILNKGIAVHQKKFNPSFHLYAGNLYLFLFVYFFLFLPQNLLEFWQKKSDALRRLWILIPFVALCFFIYFLTFHVTHPFNAPDYWEGCLRNKLLAYAQETLAGKIVFFVPVMAGLLGLLLQRFEQKQDRILLLFGPLSLIPHWLIEIRYEMVLLAFLFLFRQPKNRPVEIGTTFLYVATSAALFASILSMKYFP